MVVTAVHTVDNRVLVPDNGENHVKPGVDNRRQQCELHGEDFSTPNPDLPS